MSQESNYFGFSVAVLVVVAVVVVAIMKVADVGLSGSGSEGDMGAEAIDQRLEPVGELNTGEPKMAEGAGAAATAGDEGDQAEAAAADGEGTEQVAEAADDGAAGAEEEAGASAGDGDDGRSGEQVYNTTCVACHGTGASGAPKLGDTEAWAPRIEKGMDALMDSAMNGIPDTAMMAKGTCNDCSEQEMRRAVEYMVEQSQ